MNKLQDFSLNDYVYVKLINNGEDVLLDYCSNWGESCPSEYVLRMYEYNKGWIKIQMWDLINIFGRHLHLGNNNLPFEISNCKLEVK